MKINLLDGALGTMLIKSGIQLPQHTWSAQANIDHPNLVYKIHKAYIEAGATHLIANTFRSTARAYKKTGLSKEESKKKSKKSLTTAIALANKAAKKKTKVFASIAPLEDCYMPNLFPGKTIAKIEFQEIANQLQEGNIDGFILETMNNIAETQTCLKIIEKFNIPIWVSLNLKDSLHIKSGEKIKDTINIIKNFPVETILLNCNPLMRTIRASREIKTYWPQKWGIYPNLGLGEPSSDGNIRQTCSDNKFLDIIKKAISMGASVVGGCCGSEPKHIQLINNHINKQH